MTKYQTSDLDSMEWEIYPQDEKKSWGEGDWQNEPDKMQWKDEETGLPCLIVRQSHGGLCGYVGVPESHPLFKEDCCEIDGIAVHGGLTFSDFCDPDGKICHIAKDENEKVWWLGFDCIHDGDYIPKQSEVSCSLGIFGYSFLDSYDFGDGFGSYRNIEYVKSEIKSLANQLSQL